MCGLLGIVLGPQERTPGDYNHIQHILGRLLLLSERRGPHATGVAVIGNDGTCRIYKAPEPASTFVASAGYAELMASTGEKTTIVMGHTRWATRGTPADNRKTPPGVRQHRRHP